MKEFIEKLIGRLEEQAEQYRRRGFEHEQKGYSAMADKYYGKQCSYLHSIEIVNELAEEFATDINVVSKNGWIPCSERLPDIEGNTSDTVLVCTIDGFQHMAFWCDDEKWRYCESGMIKKPMEWTEIIAWMPLPAPYKKGE